MDLVALIPSRDRHQALAETLDHLPHGWQQIVVLDQSAEALIHPGATIIHAPEAQGLPQARNRLLNAVKAEWVVFIDDDAIPAADFIPQLEHLIATNPKVVAWGPVVESRPRWLRRVHRLLQLGALRDPRRLTAGPANLPTRALFGCCFAVRRDTALACAGFDASRSGYALGEDLDFFLRLRGPKRFAAALRCIHRESKAGRADATARGQAKAAMLRWLARRHGRHNPATILHLGLALLAAALAGRRAREAASLRGLWRGLMSTDPFVR